MIVDPLLPNVYMTNGYTEVQTQFGPGIVVTELEKLHVAIGEALVLSDHILNGNEAHWLRKQLKLCQAGAAKKIGCTVGDVMCFEQLAHVPIWYCKLLRMLWVSEIAEDDVDVCSWTSQVIDSDCVVKNVKMDFTLTEIKLLNAINVSWYKWVNTTEVVSSTT